MKTLDQLIDIAEAAGRLILEVRSSGNLEERAKEDRSPVTRADMAANEHILAALESTGIPIVSEEACPAPSVRAGWKRFWLIDPLDGTREFISGSEEFTVNIALIEEGSPTIGIIHAPALAETWSADRHGPAFIKDSGGTRPIRAGAARKPETLLESRYSNDERIEAFCKMFGISRRTPMGSSLKLCRLAEGKADVYPRFSGSSEWDIAAGQRIAEAAGCTFRVFGSGKPLVYNKESTLNPWFLAAPREMDFSGWEKSSV